MLALKGLIPALREAGMTNTEIAVAVGVSGTQITKYVKGYAAPSLGTLVAMHDILGKSLDELVFGKKKS